MRIEGWLSLNEACSRVERSAIKSVRITLYFGRMEPLITTMLRFVLISECIVLKTDQGGRTVAERAPFTCQVSSPASECKCKI